MGASRYQDPIFKKQFPEFSSISRFGIGVLSTFMIADNVEIITCHPEEESARMLELRSVHGKYLIRLLDKSDACVPDAVRAHGTSVRIQVRPSAKIGDILMAARYWIVVPACDVTVQVDEEPPIRVGFDSPREALYSSIQQSSNCVIWDKSQDDITTRPYLTHVRIEEVRMENGIIAFGLKWCPHFDEWAFLQASDVMIAGDFPWTGTCVEGIRIDSNPPGFCSYHGVAAVINAQGPMAPRTNVARSELERTPEFELLLRNIYSTYCQQVANELAEMQNGKTHSLTWAVQEAREMLKPLLGIEAASRDELISAVNQLPLILAECNGNRFAVSVQELQDAAEFWTLDGQFFRYAELLIREGSSAASLDAIIRAVGVAEIVLPDGKIVCDEAVERGPYDLAFRGKEIDRIRIDRKQRRLDLRWANSHGPSRWHQLPEYIWKSRLTAGLERPPLHVSASGVEIEGRDEETAIAYRGAYYVFSGSVLSDYLMEIISLVRGHDEVEWRFAAMAFFAVLQNLRKGHIHGEPAEGWPTFFSPESDQNMMNAKDFSKFREVMSQHGLFRVFSASAWARQGAF